MKDVEYVVEATWVLYGGTPYEQREIVEVKMSGLGESLAWAKHLRETYGTPDESRADRQYVENAIARSDIVGYDNSPELDTVLDAIAFSALTEDEV